MSSRCSYCSCPGIYKQNPLTFCSNNNCSNAIHVNCLKKIEVDDGGCNVCSSIEQNIVFFCIS